MQVNQRAKITTFIPMNDPSNFHMLKDNRYSGEREKFSRVCKFFINHYYLIGTEWLCEKVFYPSQFGFEEIENEKDHPYKKMRDQLVQEGTGLYGDRPIPRIKKPVQRIKLEVKPKRMRLQCKD